MNYNWKQAVKSAQRHGSASSGTLSGFEHIKFESVNGTVVFTNASQNQKVIESLTECGVRTIHFFGLNNAVYTQLNSQDISTVKALTRAIVDGVIKIGGAYSCVNNLGAESLAGAATLAAETPVPILLSEGDEFYGSVNSTKVIRGAASWHMWRAHVGTTNNGTKLEPNRVYMCGGIEEALVSNTDGTTIWRDPPPIWAAYNGRSKLVTAGRRRRLFITLVTETYTRIFGVNSQALVDALDTGEASKVTLWPNTSAADVTNALRILNPGETILIGKHFRYQFKYAEVEIDLFVRDLQGDLIDIKCDILACVPLPQDAHCYHDTAFERLATIKSQLKPKTLANLAELFQTDPASLTAFLTRDPRATSLTEKICYVDQRQEGTTGWLKPAAIADLEGVALVTNRLGTWSLRTGRPVSSYRRAADGPAHITFGDVPCGPLSNETELIGYCAGAERLSEAMCALQEGIEVQPTYEHEKYAAGLSAVLKKREMAQTVDMNMSELALLVVTLIGQRCGADGLRQLVEFLEFEISCEQTFPSSLSDE